MNREERKKKEQRKLVDALVIHGLACADLEEDERKIEEKSLTFEEILRLLNQLVDHYRAHLLEIEGKLNRVQRTTYGADSSVDILRHLTSAMAATGFRLESIAEIVINDIIDRRNQFKFTASTAALYVGKYDTYASVGYVVYTLSGRFIHSYHGLVDWMRSYLRELKAAVQTHFQALGYDFEAILKDVDARAKK